MGSGTNKEKDEEKKAREDVLTSVAGEVEALTGGRRMTRVFARCAEDLEKLVTSTGRPKAGGPFATAIADAERLHAEEQALADQVATLREALDSRRQKRTRLKELSDPDVVSAREEDRKKTADALETAKAHADKLSAAEANEALATDRHKTATSVLEYDDEQMKKAARLSLAVSEHNKLRIEKKEAQDTAARNDDATSTSLRAAEASVEVARTELTRAQNSRRAVEATERLTDLKERLTKAEAARGKVEDNKAAQKARALPEEAITKLEVLEQEIGALRIAERVKAANLRIDYAANGVGKVLRDGSPLSDGEAYPIAARLSQLDHDSWLAKFLNPSLTPDERSIAEIEDWIVSSADSAHRCSLTRQGFGIRTKSARSGRPDGHEATKERVTP